MLFVFMSQPDFACNPHALWKYIAEHTEHETAWVLKRPEHVEALRKRGIRCELYDTLGMEALLEKAEYVVFNSYTFGAVKKRKNQIFVNLWHGSGIKAHDFYNYDLNPQQVQKLKKFSEDTDLMCVHSLDDRFRLSAMLNFDIRKSHVTGQPRLDCVKNSDGRDRLAKVLGEQIKGFDRLIFYAPSFRANMSSHSGNFYSDNIFRVDDFDNDALYDFLKRNNAALIYKLHPIEQTAFQGRKFGLNENCFELTDTMMFDQDVRYDEFLNAFDIMASDFSSITYDFLLLDRPIVYLIPDFEKYTVERGFVFHNIDIFMPGIKADCFSGFLGALQDSLDNPQEYEDSRKRVLEYRFDFQDDRAAERCYRTILSYTKPNDEIIAGNIAYDKMPGAARHLQSYMPKGVTLIDSTEEVSAELARKVMAGEGSFAYITGEIPNEFRRLHGQSSTEIRDLEFYYQVKNSKSAEIIFVNGGVDYEFFSRSYRSDKTIAAKMAALSKSGNPSGKKRPVLGFAGTIDKRIYFAMVQYLCEAYLECDIVFAGRLFGEYPGWLHGYDNLYYMECTYQELPDVIRSFDIAILPMFGRHARTVPAELFQYLACGKSVVTSDMPYLPECRAIYRSKSVDDAVRQAARALEHADDEEVIAEAKMTAYQNDWKILAEQVLEAMRKTEHNGRKGAQE